VVRALVELGVIKPQGDMLSVRRAINYFIENIKRQTERQETIGVSRRVWNAGDLDKPRESTGAAKINMRGCACRNTSVGPCWCCHCMLTYLPGFGSVQAPFLEANGSWTPQWLRALRDKSKVSIC